MMKPLQNEKTIQERIHGKAVEHEVANFLVQDGSQLKDRLQKDGWNLDPLPDDSILAWHPQVADQRDARLRLEKLGLLTCGQLRIVFPMIPCGR